VPVGKLMVEGKCDQNVAERGSRMDRRTLRYEQLADELAGMIAERILRPGDRSAFGAPFGP